MSVITLISDWGTKDHYHSAVKGTLIKQLPDVRIVDITHDIIPFSIGQAAFVLKNTYKHFPDGTIHIIGINTDASLTTPHVIVFKDGQYFIGADNGVFSLLFDTPPDKIIEIDIIQDSDYFTFSSRDVFAKVAIQIAKGIDFTNLGFEKKEVNRKLSFAPVTEQNVIKGKVVYIDNYGNAIINITEELFREVGKGKPFYILLKTLDKEFAIRKISKSYQDVAEGERLALFNSSSLLEIAQNFSHASKLLGLHIDDMIRIEFEE